MDFCSPMSSASCGALIDDGIGEVADFEQWRNAAHGFGVAQADETAGQQIFIQIFRRHAAGGIVEVDQDVSAKNHIEPAVSPRFSSFYDIRGGELHGIAQIIEDLPVFINRRSE